MLNDVNGAGPFLAMMMRSVRLVYLILTTTSSIFHGNFLSPVPHVGKGANSDTFFIRLHDVWWLSLLYVMGEEALT